MREFTKRQAAMLLAFNLLMLIVAIAIFIVTTAFVIAYGNSKAVSAAYGISVPMLILNGIFAYIFLMEVIQ